MLRILTKALKLYPEQLSSLRARVALLELQKQRDFAFALANAESKQEVFCIQQQLTAETTELKQSLELIVQSASPAVLPEDSSDELRSLMQDYYTNHEGARTTLLTEEEA